MGAFKVAAYRKVITQWLLDERSFMLVAFVERLDMAFCKSCHASSSLMTVWMQELAIAGFPSASRRRSTLSTDCTGKHSDALAN